MQRAIALFCLLLASPLHAEDVVFTRAELDARIRNLPAAPQKTTAGHLESISRHLAAPPGDPVTEHRLRSHALALKPPLSREAVETLKALSRRSPSIYVWHEDEGHARVAEVALDAAAAARWKLRQQQVHALSMGLAAAEKPASSPERLADAATHLAGTASHEELAAVSSRLEEAFHDGAPFEHALAIVAVRRDNARLALRLVERGDAVRLRKSLRRLHDAFPDAQRTLLEAAMQRPALAPHAVPLLGAHVTQDWAWQRLNVALADRRLGATAAVALAQHSDAPRLALLAQRLDEDALTASRAALALYLNGGGYARQLLEAHRARAGDTPLAEEIGAWLRD